MDIGKSIAPGGCGGCIGGDAKRTKPRHIGLVDQFDMLDPVAAVAAAVALRCGLIAVDGLAHCPVADGMDRDLQPAPVGFGADVLEPLWPEQGFCPVPSCRDSR